MLCTHGAVFCFNGHVNSKKTLVVGLLESCVLFLVWNMSSSWKQFKLFGSDLKWSSHFLHKRHKWCVEFSCRYTNALNESWQLRICKMEDSLDSIKHQTPTNFFALCRYNLPTLRHVLVGSCSLRFMMTSICIFLETMTVECTRWLLETWDFRFPMSLSSCSQAAMLLYVCLPERVPDWTTKTHLAMHKLCFISYQIYGHKNKNTSGQPKQCTYDEGNPSKLPAAF